VTRSIFNVLFGTFTLRFSTGLTGGLLVFYLANLPRHGGEEVSAVAVSFLTAAFFGTELIASPFFGLLSDRLGHHRVMQFGPVFGAVAVTLTGLTTNLPLLGGTRILEGAATAASVPSILGFLAMATTDDEGLRGRVSARFELATLAGIGAGGFIAAPVLWAVIGPLAFFLNALIYVGSLLIYRFGVSAPDAPVGPHHRPEYGWRRYLKLLQTSHVWLLAPTWIALNAAIGVYATQGVFNLVRDRNPRFADQLLAGGLSEVEILIGAVAVGLVFFGGLIYWGNRFKRFRRTSIIFYGILGGVVLVIGALAFNHSGGLDVPLRTPFVLIAAAGLFVLAGATPAALGLLADMSEAYPDDRGAVMGLYSVFLAIGQIGGAFVGGVAAEAAGIDGILFATLVMVGIALLPLYRLRMFEHHFESPPNGRVPAPGAG
jgi:MFS family permease